MADLIVVDTAEDVGIVAEYLSRFEQMTFDTETTGLTARDEIIGVSVCAEDDKAFYIIIAAWNPATQTLDRKDTKDATRALLQSLVGKQLIAHNAVFDCMMIKAFFDLELMPSVYCDTMVLAHLLDENRRIGLKELGTTIFGDNSTLQQKAMKDSVIANGGSVTKSNYEMYKADSQLMGEYGAQDALLTYKLAHHLFVHLDEQGLTDFFYTESMPLLREVTYELNTTGLQVDTKKLTSLKKTLEAECLEAKDFIYQEIDKTVKVKYPGDKKKNVFNIGSSSQLSWLLFGELAQDYSKLTDEGKTVCRALNLKIPYYPAARKDFIAECLRNVGTIYQPEATINGKKVRAKKVKEPWSYIACDKATLKKIAPRFRWVEKLLEYQRKLKLLNTYVEGIEERTKYGIIQPRFLQTGTTSGRYSSRDPNFQNLPRDDKRIKECVVARPGKVFVGADYSQLEPRVFAYVSQDPQLMAAFDGQSDFYSVIGMGVYNKTDCTPQKEGSPDAFGIKYKKLRDLSKVIALASTYGATAHQLAPTTGKSIDDTQADIDNYFETFPGVKEMMLKSHEMAKTTGQVLNLFGRPRRMPDAKKIRKLYGNLSHSELPYEARNLLNLAVNHRIQSTGASIVNRSAIKFKEYTKLAGIDCKIVVQVHDSLVVECNESDADDIVVLLQDAMENTTILPGVPLEAVPKIGHNLGEV